MFSQKEILPFRSQSAVTKRHCSLGEVNAAQPSIPRGLQQTGAGAFSEPLEVTPILPLLGDECRQFLQMKNCNNLLLG